MHGQAKKSKRILHAFGSDLIACNISRYHVHITSANVLEPMTGIEHNYELWGLPSLLQLLNAIAEGTTHPLALGM